MKVLLKIGYTTFILPNDQGVSTIMKALAKALIVKADHNYGKKPYIEIDDNDDGYDRKLEMSYLPDKCKIVRRKPEPEDELLGLPMHLLGLPEHGTRQD